VGQDTRVLISSRLVRYNLCLGERIFAWLVIGSMDMVERTRRRNNCLRVTSGLEKGPRLQNNVSGIDALVARYPRVHVFKQVILWMTPFWDIPPCSLAEVDRRFRGAYCLQGDLIMESVHTSETSVYFETTRRYIPKGCHLHISHRENVKSYK
jgi:hypothetical protein